MSLQYEKVRPLVDILAPTVAGLVVYVVISLFTLILQTIPTLQEYLNISENWQVSRLILTQLSEFLLFIFGTNWTNTIVLGLFWAVVGLVVYFGLHGVISFVSEVSLDVHDEKNLQPIGGQPRTELRHAVERSALRLLVIIFALIYASWILWFFFKGDIPRGTMLGQFLLQHPALQALTMFVGQCLALHGFTIILRLVVLKRRLLD